MTILRALFGLGLGIVLLVAGVRCTLFGDPGPGRVDFAHAHFAPSCGPTDGPALVIYLTSREVGCRIVEPGYARKSVTDTFVQVVFYGVDQPDVPSSRGLASTEPGPSFSDGGSAVRCVDGTCTPATAGTVVFSESSAGDTLVQVTLEFEDGSSLSEQHVAAGCARVYPFCG